ncbi:hypothetical protein Tco_1122067 [Tanacetum coccineum]|uniref:Copia protein n=1 Tax=Tanacetum coccineum TaxID=301880 RepID=A0ABQ5IZH9_9ASTR
MVDYDVLYDKVTIFYDNTSAIAISNNPVLHSRTKHIDIRDHILKGDIELYFLPTELQLVDIFTNLLVEPSFTRLVAELGNFNVTIKFLALGWNLEEIHVTWDHLEKKQIRLRLYTIYLEELCIQSMETASQASSDDVRIFMVTTSWI